jgi:hypothetical protein
MLHFKLKKDSEEVGVPGALESQLGVESISNFSASSSPSCVATLISLSSMWASLCLDTTRWAILIALGEYGQFGDVSTSSCIWSMATNSMFNNF